MDTSERFPKIQLTLGTISFAICFCAWGLVGAFAPSLREQFLLSATQTSLLIATPVILGSLARIPVGLLTDRFGGRLIFTLIFLISAAAAALVPLAATFPMLLASGFLLGVAGSSFAAGVGLVSKWFPANEQGAALGVYGMGNIGQSLAVFFGPLIAASYGRSVVFDGVALLLVAWAAAFWLFGRNAPVAGTRPTLGAMPIFPSWTSPVLSGLQEVHPLAWAALGRQAIFVSNRVAVSDQVNKIGPRTFLG